MRRVALASLTLRSSPAHSSAFTSIARHQPQPTKTPMANSNDNDEITILGFGSLLSEQSSRLTFPTLKNFRLGRVPNHRRVFAHPASIFFKRNIANIDTLEMSSLSCEYKEGHSFVCSVFEVPNEGLAAASSSGFIPSQKFLEREEEFEIQLVPYYDDLPSVDVENAPMRTETSLSDDTTSSISIEKPLSDKKGVICCRSTDKAYITQWGQAHFEKQYLNYGVKTIWDWEKDSGLRPCPVYLKHCVLASWNCGKNKDGSWSTDGDGGLCYNSFLDDTYLVDRKTTIRQYLKQFPGVMATEPPESLRERYGG